MWICGPSARCARIAAGAVVEVFTGDSSPVAAKIVAIDARIDPATRNTMVRARIEHSTAMPAPGAAVRIRVPVEWPARRWQFR